MSDKKSAAALYEAFEEAAQEDVQKVARTFTGEALDTLVGIMRNQEASAGVRRQAAKDVLDQGWGRPDNRASQQGEGQAGVTIVINKLSTGEMERISAKEVATELIEAGDVLRSLDD